MEILCEDSPDVKFFARLEKILRFLPLFWGENSLLNLQNFVCFREKISCILVCAEDNWFVQTLVRIVYIAKGGLENSLNDTQ
jgi:hypothetical protein